MKFTLPHDCYKIAKNINNFYIVVFLEFLDTVIFSWIISELMYNISKGSMNLIMYYFMLKISTVAINMFFTNPITNVVAYQVKNEFNKMAHEKYDTVSPTSKNNKNAIDFDQKRSSAENAVFLMVIWGLPTMTQLFGSIVSCIWTFIKLGLLVELVIILSICVIVYYFWIRNMQNSFTMLHKSIRKINDRIKSKISLSLTAFQYKEHTPEYMIKMHKDIESNYSKIELKWIKISGSTTFITTFGGIIIGYLTMNDVTSFLLATTVLASLSSSIQGMTQFFNQYNRLTNDYNSYIEFWDGCGFVPESEKMELSNKLEISDVNIIKGKRNGKGNFTVKLEDDFGKFPYFHGIKIIIQGPSHHGKTTFIAGLVGDIQGVVMNIGKPENYNHTVANMFQTIREKLPSSKVTIRDWFKNESNNELIEECINDTFMRGELDDLKNALLDTLTESNKDEINNNAIIIDITSTEPTHPFDIELQEIPSGGQKSRLCLATRLYELKKYGKEILILDEPEQGSDPSTSVEIINHIFKKYNDKSIIMISHMCVCQLKQINVNWDLQLGVKNGIVSRCKYV